MSKEPINPKCKCGIPYQDIRKFKWGMKLLKTITEFEVYVCEKCKSYWYQDTIPKNAKEYAYKTFDKYCRGNRLPTPEQIEKFKKLYPNSYSKIDLDKYRRGEIRDYHPLFYDFYAEHMREVISNRDREVEELLGESEALQKKLVHLQNEINRLRFKQAENEYKLDLLQKKFL